MKALLSATFLGALLDDIRILQVPQQQWRVRIMILIVFHGFLWSLIRIAVFAPVQTGIVSTDIPCLDTAATLPHSLMFKISELDIICLANHVQRHAA